MAGIDGPHFDHNDTTTNGALPMTSFLRSDLFRYLALGFGGGIAIMIATQPAAAQTQWVADVCAWCAALV